MLDPDYKKLLYFSKANVFFRETYHVILIY